MQLFAVHVMDGNFEDITHFQTTRTTSEGYSIQQNKELVVRVTYFFVIARNIYKMGTDEILQWYILEFKRSSILVVMEALWEDIMQEEQPRRRFYAQGCGGQPFVRIQKHITRCVMYVKEQASHREGMKCL